MKILLCDLRIKSRILAMGPAHLQPHHMPPFPSSSNVWSSSLPQGLGLLPRVPPVPSLPHHPHLSGHPCFLHSTPRTSLFYIFIHASVLPPSKDLLQLAMICVSLFVRSVLTGMSRVGPRLLVLLLHPEHRAWCLHTASAHSVIVG